MASIDDLIPLIYHEKQESGSMLCAQHALNALLQDSYFTPPDLSDIARALDAEEAAYDNDNHGSTSTNMDDTGFFSVQVLERALQVWGLTLVRWRSEEMRPYQDHPHTQMAFILNLEQHWYTLRRFGMISSNPAEENPGIGHWFNLNSSLDAPEWISKVHLGMVLQQAELEGYSVFVVLQQDPTQPLALPRSPADHFAVTIPEQPSYTPSSRGATYQHQAVAGFENEDIELQRALQASLMDGGLNYGAYVPAAQPAVPPAPASARIPARTFASAHSVLAPSGRHNAPANAIPPPPAGQQIPITVEDSDSDDDVDVQEVPAIHPAQPADPVRASMERNRLLMERMRREQEFAFRESFDDELARIDAATAAQRAMRQAAGQGQRHAAEEDEDEMLRRAIAESEAMARAQGHMSTQDDEDADADVDVEPDDIDYEMAEPPRVQPRPQVSSRVYDDEDAELQAALKASLETLPEGFRIPDTPPPATRPLPGASARASVTPPVPAPVPVAAPPPLQRDASDASEVSTEFDTETESEEPPQEQLSMEEIRRRRLARFGG